MERQAGLQGNRFPAKRRLSVQTTLSMTECGTDDTSWVRRVRAGDEEAARALVQRLYPTVLKSVRCHLPQHCSEEDLAQAVFAKVFSKLDQFSGLVPLEHWVSRITVNTCLTQLTREKVRPELRMSDLAPEDHVVIEHLLKTEDEIPAQRAMDARELLDKLLAMLKPEERLIINLLHLEERSTHEISLLTGWSISRIKVKAFRARNKMRKAWNRLRDLERNFYRKPQADSEIALSNRVKRRRSFQPKTCAVTFNNLKGRMATSAGACVP
jgi:RNA polymerase sigma-70 factor (ECF subfamily)